MATRISVLRTRYREQIKRSPFGHISNSGMTFKDSLTDRGSRLARTVRYLDRFKEATKENIIRHSWGKKLNVPMRWDTSKSCYVCGSVTSESKTSWTITRVHKSYGTEFFGLARKCGLLKFRRVGRKVLWSLGPNANRVTR